MIYSKSNSVVYNLCINVTRLEGFEVTHVEIGSLWLFVHAFLLPLIIVNCKEDRTIFCSNYASKCNFKDFTDRKMACGYTIPKSEEKAALQM